MKNPTICEAIHNRRVLSFTYDQTARLVEPHAHGDDADGDASLRAWQTHGTEAGWRMFHVTKMLGLSITAQSFARPRPGYKKNDKDLTVIYCQL